MVDTFQGTPSWYGGDTGIIKKLAERAEQVTREPYTPYSFPKGYDLESRVAPFSPLQQETFQQAGEEARNPEYGRIFQESQGSIRNALGQNIAPQLQPYIEGANRNPAELAQQYLNPYTQSVVENIGRAGSRNLLENILPNVQDQFIRAGQYGGTGHQTFANRAIRDTQEGIGRQQTEALQHGYGQALNTAGQANERQLQSGQLLGGALGRDIERGIVGGRELQNLGESQQQARQRQLGFLGQVGSQQQGQQQNVLNTAYEDFQRQKDYPFQQLAKENALIRGLPVNEFQSQRNYLPQPPSPSGWTQGAGILAGITGAANQRQGFAKGGHVNREKSHIRHYADGGGVPSNPIQLGVNDALDTTEINFMRDQAAKLAQPQVDPFWAGITKAGFNLAANPQAGNVLGKLGQAGQEGVGEYQNQLNKQDERGIQASKIHSMIDNTLRWQKESNRKHEFDLSKFEHDKGIDLAKLGMERERLGMARATHKATMEQIKPKNSAFKKSNEKAAEEIRNSATGIPSLEKTVDELSEVTNKLDTGPVKGRISKGFSTLGDIPLVGSLIAAGDSGDVAKFEALTNELVLQLGNQLKGSQIALGKLKMIEKTKPNLLNTREGNQQIIQHIQEMIELAKEKNEFMADALENGMNAHEAENEFNKQIDSKGKITKERQENVPDLSSLSDEELKRLAGG